MSWPVELPSKHPERSQIIHPISSSSLPFSKPVRTKSKMSQTTQIRSLYRALLRELPPRVLASAESRSPLHHKLRQSFSNSASSARAVAQADQLVQYLRAQRQYVTLLERYNTGLNMDDEERVRLSARRIGMELPVEYDEKNAS
ncbi:hypothetical protein GGS20DRAFT_533460 [Poronia punctata]|nr:hypothetical protein GGS20DRAFT_533460 [Poronia punctata]